MKTFNVTGLCIPDRHYMVNTSDKLEKIMKMVDRGDYFTINRARQYGKTTTLFLLKKILNNEYKDEYIVISISFEGLGDESFESAAAFCKSFIRLVRRALNYSSATDDYKESWANKDVTNFDELSSHITEMSMNKKLVLMIDEVDKSSNNRTYLHFLGMLRDKYLDRAQDMDHTFHSVILAGVYDIKNIKLKMMAEGVYTPKATENKLYNSPWNIATDFEVDMSFKPAEIATMLTEYEADHFTGMDIQLIADEIFNYTSGYPFLVSRICQRIDEKVDKDWSLVGVQEAVHILLREKNTLFDDMFKNFENNKRLYEFVYDLLLVGSEFRFTIDDPTIELGAMYGFLKANDQDRVIVANRIFEMRMYNYFISKKATESAGSSERIIDVLQEDVMDGRRFNMELCMRKFAEHFAEIFCERDAKFIEREGRLLFISYLRPLINGQGFYHIESQFTDRRRMDIVVDFGREQFIIELKLWKGESEHTKAYEQIAGYMRSKGLTEGYLLTFDFRKSANKSSYAKWVDFNGVRIYDVVVSAPI